jgi:hypothetical protein
MLKRNPEVAVKLVLIVILLILLTVLVRSAKQVELEEVEPTEAALVRATPAPMKKALVDAPKLFPDLTYVVYYEPDATKEYLDKIQKSICELENLDKSEYTLKAVNQMSKEVNRLKELAIQVSSDLNHYLNWEKEYYYAAKVWEYFRQRGFNNEITCAIIGNMMIETSGGSLALKPKVYDPTAEYYGLCQWSLEYYPGTKDLPFEYQLDYLLGSMPWEFNTFGWLYKEGFTYEDFLEIKDPAEAAFVFAKVYERCWPTSYNLRQDAAIKAYEYFNLNS